MVPPNEINGILAKLDPSSLLGSLDATWHEKMCNAGHLVNRKQGALIIAEEEDAPYFYFILSGRVKICRTHPVSGRSVTLFLLHEGGGFDLINLLDRELHTVAAEALEEVNLLALPKNVLRDWMSTEPAFTQALLPCLGQRMNDLADMASDSALLDTTARLARLIVKNVRRENGHWWLEHISDLPHHELAEMLGTVRVVLNRQIQTLKADGIIEVNRKSLRVKDLERLELLCQEGIEAPPPVL